MIVVNYLVSVSDNWTQFTESKKKENSKLSPIYPKDYISLSPKSIKINYKEQYTATIEE
jgi:hypothetical protein